MRTPLPELRHGVLTWLVLTVFTCYFNALSGTFQFDDYNVIVDNPAVHSWEAWLAGLGHGIRPLLKFSYMLNWVSGLGSAGFHLANLLIHLCNTYLVYRLVGEFVNQQSLRKLLCDVPLFAALLFATHPIHTEAVTYVCGRSASLMLLFFLAGLLAYVTGRTQHNKIFLYLITPLLFVLALSVKETAVTFPFALLAWELCCGGTWKISFRQQWSSWVLLLLTALFFLFNEDYATQMERSAKLNSLQGNAATQLLAFSYLMRQWMLPLWLNIDPDLPLLHDAAGIALPLIFFIALFALMLICWRRRPWISFALAWAMIQLIPLHLFLPRLDIANDRQTYLVSWPLALALAAEMAIWLKQKTFALAGALLLLVSGSLTVLRNQDYVNEMTLWEVTVKQSPNKARVHNNLGYAYMLAKRNEEAQHEFKAALQLDPLYFKARNNLDRLNDQ